MNLLERIFDQPELRDDPPVLVDVGAAGGVHPVWRRIARFSIGVGFEPDAREAAPLGGAQRLFRRWVFCPGLAVASAPADGQTPLHLTRSPQCSSSLRPRAAAVGEWAFADFFEVIETRSFPSTTIAAALSSQGLSHVDWLKCDTQGTDLALYQSLPPTLRARLLAVEFEPGLTDIYEGEDKMAEVLTAMSREPFWLADLQVGRTPRVRPELIAAKFGTGAIKWARRLAPGAPAWGNVMFLRDAAQLGDELDRRALLLNWVFTSLAGQYGAAISIAEAGAKRFGPALFDEMSAASVRSLRWSMVRGVPALFWRRFIRT